MGACVVSKDDQLGRRGVSVSNEDGGNEKRIAPPMNQYALVLASYPIGSMRYGDSTRSPAITYWIEEKARGSLGRKQTDPLSYFVVVFHQGP